MIRNGTVMHNQLQKYSVDVWAEVENYIGKEFKLFSETSNNLLLKEYFLTLANECHDHTFKLKRVSNMIHIEEKNNSLSIVNPINILKRYGVGLRSEHEFKNFVKFYSGIISQLANIYCDFLKKTNNMEVQLILKKLCDEKKYQETFLVSLID